MHAGLEALGFSVFRIVHWVHLPSPARETISHAKPNFIAKHPNHLLIMLHCGRRANSSIRQTPLLGWRSFPNRLFHSFLPCNMHSNAWVKHSTSSTAALILPPKLLPALVSSLGSKTVVDACSLCHYLTLVGGRRAKQIQTNGGPAL